MHQLRPRLRVHERKLRGELLLFPVQPIVPRSLLKSVLPMSRLLLCAVVSLSLLASAQSPCEAKCNQQASDCLKRCAGDPKDASKPDQAKRLMECLKTCEVEVKPCRDTCRK